MKSKKQKLVKKLKHYFWVEGDEGSGDKYYLGDDPILISDFLKNNDPCLCGTDLMTEEQFDKLPEW